MKSVQRLEKAALDSSGSYRVGRGGDLDDSADYCSVALRGYSEPDYRGGLSSLNRITSLSFRVVRAAN